MAISRARAMVEPQDISTWFNNVDRHVLVKPGVAEAFKDPNRVWNTVRHSGRF